MATWYLNADTGNDTTGDGSSSLPWLTVSKAHASASSGDTIVFQKSTASYVWASLTFAKSLTLHAISINDAILDGANVQVVWTIAGVTVVCANLIFRNANNTGSVLTDNNFKFTTTGAVLTMVGCIIRDSVAISSGSGGGGLFTGVAGSAYTLNLTGVLIYGITFSGGLINRPLIGSFAGGTLSTLTVNITNCTFYRSGVATDFNFLFSSADGSGRLNATVKNTIIYNASGTLDWSKSVNDGIVTNVSDTYSDFYALTGAPTGTGVITSDPQFVDPTNNNFNLRPTSPCIDAGVLA